LINKNVDNLPIIEEFSLGLACGRWQFVGLASSKGRPEITTIKIIG
jgi:hypothetical protein